MPRQRYDKVAHFTNLIVGRPVCLTSGPSHVPLNNFQITLHDRWVTRACFIPRALTCRYLQGVLELSDMNWTAAESGPMKMLTDIFKCNHE